MTNTNICTIGSGTGQATILKALSTLENVTLTGIVATTDNGGSSAAVRESLNIPSPGDVRNCINHLTEETSILSQLLNYRYKTGDLKGVHVGNLIIGALSDITRSYTKAVELISQDINLPHTILPVSNESAQICAELETGQWIEGERQIIKRRNPSKIRRYFLNSPAQANPKAIEAIEQADICIICPGVLGTGIISTLLHEGLQDAIRESKCKLVHFCNIMTFPSQTDHFTVSDHINLLNTYTGKPLDIVYANTLYPPEYLLDHYSTYGYEVVEIDKENIDTKLVTDEFLIDYTETSSHLELERAAGKNQQVRPHFIRHDLDKIVKHIDLLIKDL